MRRNHEPTGQYRHRTDLLEGIGQGRDPEAIAAPFAEDLVFEIQGDEGAMPWIGRATGAPGAGRGSCATCGH